MVKILLVEDNRKQAETLTRFLNKVAPPNTLEMFQADNLETSLTMSRELKASVTFLDLLIPLRPGEAPIPATDWRVVAAHIRDYFPPVIVITALDDFEIEFECVIKQGAQAVFTKPKARSFFSWLANQQQEFFAEHLLAAAGRTVFRSKRDKIDNGQ